MSAFAPAIRVADARNQAYRHPNRSVSGVRLDESPVPSHSDGTGARRRRSWLTPCMATPTATCCRSSKVSAKACSGPSAAVRAASPGSKPRFLCCVICAWPSWRCGWPRLRWRAESRPRTKGRRASSGRMAAEGSYPRSTCGGERTKEGGEERRRPFKARLPRA
jgi:hypothetical protein